MKNYAIIPARAGSKGLPGKNIKTLLGKPLIAWTIEQAISAKCFDRVIVSTDSPDIARISKDFGAEVPFLRPKELAGDEARTVDVVLYLADKLGFEKEDRICLLQPTSPLRDASDILKCCDLMDKPKISSAVSVVRFKLAKEFLFQQDNDECLILPETSSGSTNRQESVPHFHPNGAVYWCRVQAMVDARRIIVPAAMAYEMDYWKSIDIDSEQDFEIAEFLLNQSNHGGKSLTE